MIEPLFHVLSRQTAVVTEGPKDFESEPLDLCNVVLEITKLFPKCFHQNQGDRDREELSKFAHAVRAVFGHIPCVQESSMHGMTEYRKRFASELSEQIM